MKQSADLKRLLTSIDHKSYPAYKDVRGAYDFNTYILYIDHVQGPICFPFQGQCPDPPYESRIPGRAL